MRWRVGPGCFLSDGWHDLLLVAWPDLGRAESEIVQRHAPTTKEGCSVLLEVVPPDALDEAGLAWLDVSARLGRKTKSHLIFGLVTSLARPALQTLSATAVIVCENFLHSISAKLTLSRNSCYTSDRQFSPVVGMRVALHAHAGHEDHYACTTRPNAIPRLQPHGPQP